MSVSFTSLGSTVKHIMEHAINVVTRSNFWMHFLFFSFRLFKARIMPRWICEFSLTTHSWQIFYCVICPNHTSTMVNLKFSQLGNDTLIDAISRELPQSTFSWMLISLVLAIVWIVYLTYYNSRVMGLILTAVLNRFVKIGHVKFGKFVFILYVWVFMLALWYSCTALWEISQTLLSRRHYLFYTIFRIIQLLSFIW